MLTISTVRNSKTNIEKIVIDYKSRKLIFNGKAKVWLEGPIDNFMTEGSEIFDCQNEFVNNTFDDDEKLALFKLYEKAHKICESGKEVDYLEELHKCKEIVDEVYSLFNVNKYMGFIQYSKYLKVPNNLLMAASKGDYPAETTILEDGYINLAKFSFAVRVILPITFSLTERFTQNMGIQYAQLNIGQLVSSSPALTNLPGWDKLKIYIKATFTKHGITQQLTEFSSGSNAVEKTVFKVIFDRLVTAVIPETDKDKNLATTINSCCQTAKTTLANSFREKEDSYSGDGDDKRSTFEKYQLVEENNTSKEQSDVEWFTFGMFDEREQLRPNGWFKHQANALGVDEELIEMVHSKLPKTWKFYPGPHILEMLRLTFFDEISVFCFRPNEGNQNLCALDWHQLMAAIAIGQVKLASMGYKYLPGVLGCIEDPDGLRTIDSLKMSNEDRERIEVTCSVQSKNTEARTSNEAIIDATEFLDYLGNGVWKTNLEVGCLDNKELYSKYPAGELFTFEMNRELKEEFVDLVVRVGSI